MNTILAIDPSICNLGIAILTSKKQLLYVGTIKTKSEGVDRFKEIANLLNQVIQTFKPDTLAIETQYFTGLKSNSVLKTCEVKGLCRGVFLINNPFGNIIDIEPSKAKKALGVTGLRKEVKQKTINMVKLLYPQLRIGQKLDDNGADAIAIGLASISLDYIRK